MKKRNKPQRNVQKKRSKRKTLSKNFSEFTKDRNFLTDSDDMFEDSELQATKEYDDWENDFDFPLGDPTFEIHTDSDVSVESIKSIKKLAWSLAGQHTVAEFKGADAGTFLNYVSILEHFPDLELRLENLIKIVLIDNGKKGWVVEFHYVPNQGTDQLIALDIPPFTGAHSRENADEYVIQVIADLIVDHGKKYPDESVHSCTFLLDDVVFSISKEKMDLIKSAIEEDAEQEDTGEFSFDDADNFFKELRIELGEKKISDKINDLDLAKKAMVRAYICLSLMNGERCWPFRKHGKVRS